MTELDIEEMRKRLADLTAAAVDCCPDTWQARRIANSEHPVYVEQMQFIESEEDDILKAVKEYVRGNASRLEWYQKGYVKEADVAAYEHRFVVQHEEIFKRPVVDGETEAARGQETLRQCKLCGSNNQLSNRQPYAEFPEGTLHKLSNSRIIGWHPQWESRFGKAKTDDRTYGNQ